MNDTTLSITPETLPAIMWQNKPVITTELLADIYDAKAIQIQQNFKNNASRFIEGIHFFKLVGAELKAFKNRLDKIESVEMNRLDNSHLVQIVGKNAKSLMLWTERGTVRHAKILDTDNAWAVQDRLEDFYFQKHQPETATPLLEPPTITKAQWGEINARVSEIADLTDDVKKTKLALWSRFNKHFRIGGYKELPREKFDDAIAYLELKKLDYPATKEPEMKKTSLRGYASMILGIEGNQRLVVQEHGDVTVVMKLNPDDFVGTFETIVRELKSRGYLVVKQDELVNQIATLAA